MSKGIFVYFIVCADANQKYIKIGNTINLYKRVKNLQTGSPLKYTKLFVIDSLYKEEVLGLEMLLHRHLPKNIRGEWYLGSNDFFNALVKLVKKINRCDFTFEEIDELPDENAGPTFEIMLHGHNFQFYKVSMPFIREGNLSELSTKITYDEFIKEISR